MLQAVLGAFGHICAEVQSDVSLFVVFPVCTSPLALEQWDVHAFIYSLTTVYIIILNHNSNVCPDIVAYQIFPPVCCGFNNY